MQHQLEISLAIFVPFIVANANRPEYAAIGPPDREAQVRDHPQPDMRVRFPCFVLASVRDEQRLTGLHDGLAIRSRIESARLARISFGRAGDENLDVGRIDPHYGGRGHVHDLGKEIHKLLPFSDDFRGHFDRMCHTRAAILRLRSGPFSVDTSVHTEQFLGLDADAMTIPRMIKVLSEGFDPAWRLLLFCESANLRLHATPGGSGSVW